MAAFDAYQAFNRSIPEQEHQGLRELQSMTWSELVAARSEEARLRVVEGYVREVRERLMKQRG